MNNLPKKWGAIVLCLSMAGGCTSESPQQEQKSSGPVSLETGDPVQRGPLSGQLVSVVNSERATLRARHLHLHPERADKAYVADPPGPKRYGVKPQLQGSDPKNLQGAPFSAIDFDGNETLVGAMQIPADPSGAAGTSQLVNVVNSSIEVRDRSSGSLISSLSLEEFFFGTPLPGIRPFDPRVLYDQHDDRFVVVAAAREEAADGAAQNRSRVLMAVSQSGTLTGVWANDWYFTEFDTTLTIGGQEHWLDFPGLGVDKQALYVTGNFFQFKDQAVPGLLGGSRLVIVDKADLYMGMGPVVFSVENPTAAVGCLSNVTHQPAHVVGSTPGNFGTFLVGFDGITAGSNQLLQVIRVDDSLTSPVFTCDLINLGNIDGDVNNNLPDAPQMGLSTDTMTSMDIETNSRRVLSAAYGNNSLLTATTVNPPGGHPDNGQATVYWLDIDTTDFNNLSLSASGFIDGEDIAVDTHTYYPTVAINDSGGMVLGFSASGANLFVGSYFTLRSPGDPSGTNRGSVELNDGEAYYQRTLGAGSNRWGDYSAAARDPAGACFWLYNQHSLPVGNQTPDPADMDDGLLDDDDGRYGTAHAQYCNESPVGTDDSAQIANRSVTDTVTVLLSGQSDLLFNDVDPDLNISGGNIDALFLTGTAITPPDHGTVDLNFGSVNGAFRYVNDGTPNLDMMGEPIIKPDGTPDMDDSFVYEVCDDGSPSICDTATVSIEVLSDNHAVDAMDDAIDVDEAGTATDVTESLNLLDNDLRGTPTDDPGQTLTVNTTPVAAPQFGILILNADGSFSYTHDGTENFTDSFDYEVCDDGIPVLCDEATVDVTINPVNETPMPQGDTIGQVVTLSEDAIATTLDTGQSELDANDTDPDGDALFVETTPTTAPSFGSLILNADGTFSYDHDGTENFVDFFDYRVCDRASAGDPERLCADARVDITITAVNDPPVAGGGTITISEGQQDIQVLDDATTQFRDLATDIDDDDATLVVTSVVNLMTANGGTVNITGPAGTFEYDHDGSEFTSDSFTYEVCDDESACTDGTINVVINAIDDVPVANPDFISVMEAGVAILLSNGIDDSVLDNDMDADSTLTAVLISGPQFNSIAQPFQFNSDGTFQYTHDGSENFSDSFTYQACEVGGLARCTATTTVSITVNSVNESPTLMPDGFVVAEGNTFDSLAQGLNLLTNDSDPDGDPLVVLTTPAIAPGNAASFQLNSDGTFVYEHNGSEGNSDSFTYTACDRPDAMDPDRLCADAIVNITVSAVNDPPVAGDDLLSDIAEDSGATLISANALLGNDLAGGGETQTLTLVSVSNPSNGSVQLSGPDVQFTPDPDFNGAASFDYTMQDDDNEGPPTFLTATATASFTVTEVNDVPTPSNDTIADAIEDTLYVIDPATVLANDTDKGAANESGQILAVDSVGTPTNGSVSINGGTGMIEFDPTPGFNGTASFRYFVIDDGTTNGVLDPQTSSAFATVTFQVLPANDPPVAMDDTGPDVTEDTAQVNFLYTDLLSNDTPTPGETETISITDVSSPVGGTVVLNNGAGQVEFTPSADFNGAASFIYTLSDDAGGGAGGIMTDTATVSFTITEVNDPPIAMDDNPSAIPEDMTSVFTLASLLSNDTPGPVTATDETGQILTLVSVGNAVNGTAQIMGMTVEFTPDMNYSGPASFDYTIDDDGTTNGAPDVQSDTATVFLLVDSDPDPPTANDDGLTAIANNAATVLDGGATSLLDNDTDPDSPLTVTQITGMTTEPAGTPVTTAQGATVTVQADGTFSYLFTGSAPAMDSFDYEVCDDTSPMPLCDTATVNISVLDAGNIAACAPGGRRVVDGVPVAIDTSGEFTGSGLTYGVVFSPTTAHLSINAGSGIVTGLPDATDVANSPLLATVTATGGPMPQTIEFEILVQDQLDGLDVVFYSGVESSCVGL